MHRRKSRPDPDQPRLTLGYCRVSTDEQADKGVSLAAQEERIRAFCIGTGRQLDEVVVDRAASAKDLRRPGVSRILDAVRAGTVGAVVILKLDRLTRSVRDLADLLDECRKYDVALVSISESLDTGSAGGRMVVNMLGVVAQWEREIIGERTAFALAHKRRARRVYGSTPFGWQRKGDQLVEDPAQQIAFKRARGMRAKGASLRAIADDLTRRKVAPPRGQAWYASSVRAVLHSKIAAEAA
jgi:site-specific DNA recombinase